MSLKKIHHIIIHNSFGTWPWHITRHRSMLPRLLDCETASDVSYKVQGIIVTYLEPMYLMIGYTYLLFNNKFVFVGLEPTAQRS